MMMSHQLHQLHRHHEPHEPHEPHEHELDLETATADTDFIQIHALETSPIPWHTEDVSVAAGLVSMSIANAAAKV